MDGLDDVMDGLDDGMDDHTFGSLESDEMDEMLGPAWRGEALPVAMPVDGDDFDVIDALEAGDLPDEDREAPRVGLPLGLPVGIPVARRQAEAVRQVPAARPPARPEAIALDRFDRIDLEMMEVRLEHRRIERRIGRRLPMRHRLDDLRLLRQHQRLRDRLAPQMMNVEMAPALNAAARNRANEGAAVPGMRRMRALMDLFRRPRGGNNDNAQVHGLLNNAEDMEHAMEHREVIRMLERENPPPIPPYNNRFLFDLIREDLSCVMHTGNPHWNCRDIVRFCSETPEAIHFVEDRTRRTPLHEAALRCSCIHTIRALVQNTSERIPQTRERLLAKDTDANTPLQLYMIGLSQRSVMAVNDIAEILGLLMGSLAFNIPASQNSNGNNSLHLACRAPEPMIPSYIIETFLSAMSNGPTIANRDSKTPLHVHCARREASVEVARMLIENVREFNFLHDSHGKTPIHYAALQSNGPLVEYLIEATPASVTQRTTDTNKNVLHLFKNIDVRTLEKILRASPDVLAARTSDTLMTPLHTLLTDVRIEVNPEVVQMMVERAPGILLLADHLGFLPIHYACQTGRDTKVVKLLLTPQTVTASTLKNDTALSIAASQNSCLETVQLLIEAYKPALGKPNNYGFLPLHCVCRAPQPKETIIRALIEANPEARKTQTHAGELPLHLAHKGASAASLHILGHDENSISALDTLVSKSKVGNTPLHTACLHLSNVENIERMAEDHPEWLLAVNNAGFNPVQLMCRKGLINERLVHTIYTLVGVRPFESVDTAGHTPLHSAVGSGSEEAVLALIDVYPSALKMKTVYGDTPLHLACHRDVYFLGEIARITCEKATQHGSHTSPLLILNKAGQTPISIVMAELKAKYDGCMGKVQYYSQVAAVIKILYYGTEGFEQGGIVKACLALHRSGARLDPSFIRRVIMDHPEEVRVPDKDGNYPLHLEASIPVEKMVLLDGGSCVCHNPTCCSRKSILKTLLDIYPEAAKYHNNDGDSVLDLLMKNGRRWDSTFAFIVRANPAALHSVDNHELMPQIIDRIGNGCGPSTLYTFLRARPNLILNNR